MAAAKLDPSLNGTEELGTGSECIEEELRDLFALTDSRNLQSRSQCYLRASRPAQTKSSDSAVCLAASRGDQILNARSFERQGFSMVLEEEELTNETLLSAVHDLYDNREKYIDAMKHSSQQDSIDTIIDLIESVTA